MGLNISYHPYDLTPLQRPNAVTNRSPRIGALIRVESSTGVGYSDLHPWPVFGDEDLEKQLSLLAAGTPTSLGQRSLDLAARDADARSQKVSLIDPEMPIENNITLSLLEDSLRVPELEEQGFNVVKWKIGGDPLANSTILNRLKSPMLWRLDVNAAWDVRTFNQFLSALSPLTLSGIEYVEDPTTYQQDAWAQFRKRLPLAMDFAGQGLAVDDFVQADVRIVKPARQIPEAFFQQATERRMGITITSSMDHPVGVMHALSYAQECKRAIPQWANVAGCLTHLNDEPNEFSAMLKHEGPILHGPGGLGIGFDELLGKIQWKKLTP